MKKSKGFNIINIVYQGSIGYTTGHILDVTRYFQENILFYNLPTLGPSYSVNSNPELLGIMGMVKDICNTKI